MRPLIALSAHALRLRPPLAPNIKVVLVGWCIAQLFFNALLAAMVAVLPDQVPAAQRGLVSGVLGVCLPIASVSGTFLVKLLTGNQLAMFLVPCAISGFFILLFAVTLKAPYPYRSRPPPRVPVQVECADRAQGKSLL